MHKHVDANISCFTQKYVYCHGVFCLLVSADQIVVAGAGKRTVIRHVAQRLGLHIVEYSCHNLMSSAERKTSVALAQVFNTAHR